ncbi:glycerate kinase II [Escherichia coli]|uniref:Glycerate kinase II n=1 Tax=Escherichia coli TaxID=562 RepID=A0A377B1L3_ECOLX|nr:glycerate kinase II [Escherichia coli]
MNAVNLAQAVQGAALVITGEGRIDSQTAGGKAPLGVASVAKQFNVPVIGIAGVLGDGVEVVHQYGIDAGIQHFASSGTFSRSARQR